MSKKIITTIFVLVIICSLHFFAFVMPNEGRITNRKVSDKEWVLRPDIESKLTPELLALVYGIEYIAEIKEKALEPDEDQVVIYLDQTAVTVKAILKVDNSVFVIIDYVQGGELIRSKLQVGDAVLGYRLVDIDSRTLFFTSNDNTKKLQFNIFKRSQNNG